MRDTDYAYCVARLRAVEGTLLKKEDYDRLLSFESLEEAEKLLLFLCDTLTCSWITSSAS